MADLSSAEVGGGIVFELKGDPAPLRAMLKQETSHKYELKIGIDPQAIQQLKSVFTSVMAEFRQASTIKIKPELDQQAVRKVREQVDHETKGHGDISRKNILSMRGLETLGIGGSATAAFAIIEATRLAGEYIESQNIRSNSQRVSRNFEHVGGWSAASDPYIQRQSKALADANADMKILEMQESVPILGNLSRIANSAFDVRGGIEDKQFEANKAIQEREYLHKESISAAVRDAALTDDQVQAHKIEAKEKMEGAVNVRASAANELWKIQERLKNEDPQGTHSTSDYAYQARTQNPDVAAKLDEASKLVDTLEKLNAAEEEQLKRVKDSAITRLQGSIIGTGFDLRATGATTGFSIGGARAAMELQQAGALGRFDKDTEATLGTIKDPVPKEQTRISRAADRAKVEADQTKQSTDFQIQEDARIAKNETEINQNTIHNNAAINATKLQGDRQFFEAKKQAARDASAAELQAAQSANNAEFKNLVFSQHAGPAEIVSAVRRMASGVQSIQLRGALNQQGLDTEEGYRVTQSILDSAASSQSSALKAGGFNWEAHVATRNHEQYKALGQIENKQEWTAKLAEFRANNDMEEKGHKFELQDRKIARDADFNAAVDRQNDLPISAQIEQAAAAARLAIRNADPGEREEVRKTEMAKFKATEHELLGIHGGGYAAKGTAFFTPGDPLGLGKGAQDRENAAKVAADKEKEITNQQGKDIGDISKWLTDTFWDKFSDLCNSLPMGLIGNSD